MAPTIDSDPGRELVARIADTGAKPLDIARFLDGLSPEDRVRAVRAAGRDAQRRLYELVEGFRPLALSDIVPPDVPAMTPVHHLGRNTLPLFRLFEKRFCRPPEVDPATPDELWGYNESPARPLVGPGYFVLRPDAERGELLVDYHRVPPRRPDGWPEIRSNARGVSRFVYGFMIDTLRGVSAQVTIGSAARKGRDLGSWFILCRAV
jgi:hypothetical protein